jgi:hypothetical protein
MKFISNKIVTRPVSLEDAMKVAQGKKNPSLDDVLASIKKGNEKAAPVEAKKTEEAQPKETTASVEVKVDDSLKKEANLDNLGDKAALPFGKKKDDDDDEKDEDEDEDEEKDEEKKDDEKKEESCSASSSKVIKIAKQLDFRSWEAQDVVQAWSQHGSMDKCVENVKGHTTDAKVYCKLLQVSSQLAKKSLTKTAKKQESHPKKAKKGTWLKVSKLTGKQRSMLEEYYRKLYGDMYVDALLRDY